MQPEESLRAIEELETLPLGACLATRVVGRCMWPLIRSGDVLVVRRSAADSVGPGDIAIVRTANGRFLAHLVVGVRPLRTATLRGKLDALPIDLLGCVVSIRKKSFAIPLSNLSRQALWLLHRSYVSVRTSSLTRFAVGAFRKLETRALPTTVRGRLLRPIRVRRLNILDAEALRIFAGQYLVDSPDYLKRQLLTCWLRAGAAVAAVDRFDRWCGFAYLGAYHDQGFALEGFGIRSLFVAPFARGLGLERRMAMLLCQEAQQQKISPVYANVVEKNPALVSLLEDLGFTPSPRERERRVAAEWAKRGVVTPWAALERS